jgi:monoterpene epsilon-lactone hydrolase
MSNLQHRLLRSTLSALFGNIRRNGYTIPGLRKSLDTHSLTFFLPWGVETESVRIGRMSAEWVLPRNADHNKVLLYLHGGGYTVGSAQTHRSLVGAIAKAAGVCGLTPEYRLAPEHPFPAALHDATDTYEWLLKTGHLPEDIVVAGDSAGGGLALALMQELITRKVPLPAGIALLAPWVDLRVQLPSVARLIDVNPTLYIREMKAWARHYAGDLPIEHPQISPLFANLTGLPPMLMQVSDQDALIDENLQLAKQARAAGVDLELQEWKGLIHVWQVFWRELPQAQEAVDKLGDFVKRVSAKAHANKAASATLAG